MGERALVVFHDGEEYSPTVYLHWEGQRIGAHLQEWEELMKGRTGDLQYGAARFIGICHTHVPGALSLGVWNTDHDAPAPTSMEADAYWREKSHGDAGVFLVDVRTESFGKVRVRGGYGFGRHELEEGPGE